MNKTKGTALAAVAPLLLVLVLGFSSAHAQLLFEDDFSDPSLQGWILDSTPPEELFVESEELHLRAAHWSGNRSVAYLPPGIAPQNYSLSFDYKQVSYSGWMEVNFSLAEIADESYGNRYWLGQDGANHILPLRKTYELAEPVVIDNVVYTNRYCFWGQSSYFNLGGQSTGFPGDSCWCEPLSDYSEAQFNQGTGADNNWHHMSITKLGPEITIALPDTGLVSKSYDCQPLEGGLQSLGVADFGKHVHFDNVRLESLDGPLQAAWDTDLNRIAD